MNEDLSILDLATAAKITLEGKGALWTFKSKETDEPLLTYYPLTGEASFFEGDTCHHVLLGHPFDALGLAKERLRGLLEV